MRTTYSEATIFSLAVGDLIGQYNWHCYEDEIQFTRYRESVYHCDQCVAIFKITKLHNAKP